MTAPRIAQIKGDLFSAPKGSVLMHACNCVGSWSSGIAAIFKQKFPEAFDKYEAHCSANKPNDLIGTCFLIQDKDYTIACLMTSRYYGARKDPPETILASTRSAMQQLLADSSVADKGLCSCKLNALRFATPWEETKSVMEEECQRAGRSLTVYDR